MKTEGAEWMERSLEKWYVTKDLWRDRWNITFTVDSNMKTRVHWLAEKSKTSCLNHLHLRGSRVIMSMLWRFSHKAMHADLFQGLLTSFLIRISLLCLKITFNATHRKCKERSYLTVIYSMFNFILRENDMSYREKIDHHRAASKSMWLCIM